MGQIARTRRNPASQTIIRRLSQCSSRVRSVALLSILHMSHFPMTSGKSTGFAASHGLTGGLPDVGTDAVLHGSLIRGLQGGHAGVDRLQGAVIAVSVLYWTG